MSRNYKFHNSEGVYFISFAVVGWLDVFTRNEYKNILIDSLHYFLGDNSRKSLEFALDVMDHSLILQCAIRVGI